VASSNFDPKKDQAKIWYDPDRSVIFKKFQFKISTRIQGKNTVLLFESYMGTQKKMSLSQVTHF